MNRTTRNKISELTVNLESISSQLETFAEFEREKFDKLSDEAAEGEAGQAIEAAADALEAAVAQLANAIDDLTGIE